MQLIREVEHHALALRDRAPAGDVMALDEPAPHIDLAMDRPLYTPPFKPTIADDAPAEGADEISADALFEQTHVDKLKLAAQVRRALQTRGQISLAELVEAHPVEQGLAELIAYLSLAAEDRLAVIDDTGAQTFAWTDETGRRRQATLPLVVFNQRPALVPVT